MRVFVMPAPDQDRALILRHLAILGHTLAEDSGLSDAAILLFDATSFETAAAFISSFLLRSNPPRTILVQKGRGPARIHGALEITCSPHELDVALKYTQSAS